MHKLLFDQNLSYRIVKQLKHLFPAGSHAENPAFQRALAERFFSGFEPRRNTGEINYALNDGTSYFCLRRWSQCH